MNECMRTRVVRTKKLVRHGSLAHGHEVTQRTLLKVATVSGVVVDTDARFMPSEL